ncbi:MAG: translation initiation factor IF-2 N-terminal domain-containing protein [Pseudonocardiaceae bacterium]
MANMKAPAGGTGGPTGASEADTCHGTDLGASLPDKLRVHALARLLSVSSREIMATLTELGVAVRSAQSSIDRETALRAAQVLLPDPEPDEASIDSALEPEIDSDAAEVSMASPSPVPLAPVFNAPAPVFLPPSPKKPSSAEESEADGADSSPDGEMDTEGGARRRRRRGRRGRGRGKTGDGTEDDSAEQGDGDLPDADNSADEQSEDSESGEAGARRRRRRRRRRDGGDDEAAPREDDPPDTVVHVREIKDRPAEDEVQAVRGSTRLEAKRQRRRDGREAGRRRAPILSESEFLTRREAVARTMVVREDVERTQIGVLEDDVLVEHFVTASGSGSLVGNVYLGKVQNVLPSMEAAFVDIGRGRNAVLYAGEVDWDAAGLEGKARRIEQALSSGDSVLVQVTKDPVGHKGSRLTTQISLPGRFLVYVPGGRATGISRKLPDNERKRLKDVLKRILPEDAGVIIRTASEGVSEDELARDVRRLQAQWEVIQGKSGSPGGKVKTPELLYEEPDLLVKVVRDLFTEDFRELVVQGEEAWDTVEGYVQHVAPDLIPRVRRYTGNGDVFAEFRIDEQIVKALDRKVWLPSGGYLVIDRTEAMTVIDVNTGKFTGSGGNLEETVTRNNLEAAEEIIRQLRLRDVGGIIVIDFIDMVLESNRDLVLRRLTECLGRDRTRHQVAEVTSLGLVQMTRKRIGTGLLEAHSTTCEHCKGRGVLISAEPVNVRSAVAQPASGSRESSGGGTRRARSRGRGSGSGAAAAEQPVPENGATASGEPPAEPQPVTKNQPVTKTSAPHPEAELSEPAAASEPAVDPHAAAQSPSAPTGKSDDPMFGPTVNGAAVQPPTTTGEAQVPAQPAPRTRTRRRRAASRPAGPPTTDQPNEAEPDAQVSSAVQQAG